MKMKLLIGVVLGIIISIPEIKKMIEKQSINPFNKEDEDLEEEKSKEEDDDLNADEEDFEEGVSEPTFSKRKAKKKED